MTWTEQMNRDVLECKRKSKEIVDAYDEITNWRKNTFLVPYGKTGGDSDAALLTDASNAFNSLNKAASLHSIRVLCPVM